MRGRAGFPSSDPEARRPLPAASPASGAGAGLARHLLHIDAAAAASRASRASPAPGMQRLWRAGPPGEGEGAIVAGPVPPPRLSFPVGVRAGGWGVGGSDGRPELSGACSTAPLPEMFHQAACSSSQEPGLGFRFWCHLSPSEWPRAQRLTFLGQSILLSSGGGGGRGGMTVILCGAG